MAELEKAKPILLPFALIELASYDLNKSVLHSATEQILLLIFFTCTRGPGVLTARIDWYCLSFPGRFSFFSIIHYY